MSPRTTRRQQALAVALAGITVAASGCTVANSRHGGYDPNTLRIVLSQEPPTLEPCESSLTSTGIVVRSNITEPLIERDPNSGDLQPLLATEWRQTSPNQWTFKVRDGVTFSNGAPMTAKDAAYSIDRAVNSDLNCNVDGYVFGDDTLELSTPDDNTLVVGTKDTGSDSPAAHLVRRDRADGHQHDREGPRAHRHRPLRHRRLGVRPEAVPQAQRHLLGREAGVRQGRIPVAQRGQRPRRDDHQRRDRHRRLPRTRGRRRRSRRPVPEQRDHRAAHAGHRGAAQRHARAPGHQLRRQPHRHRQGAVPRSRRSRLAADPLRRRRIQRPTAAVAPRSRQGQEAHRGSQGRRRARRHRRSASSAAPPSSRRSPRPSRCCRASSPRSGSTSRSR